MSIIFNDHPEKQLNVIVSYSLFSENPGKLVLYKNTKQCNDYDLDEYYLYLLTVVVDKEDFKYHIWHCVKLFIEDAKKHLKINNIKLVYLLTAVNNTNNCICILIISTDFYFCKSPLDIWKRDNDDILKDFTDFRIYSYNLKKKEMGIYLSN